MDTMTIGLRPYQTALLIQRARFETVCRHCRTRIKPGELITPYDLDSYALTDHFDAAHINCQYSSKIEGLSSETLQRARHVEVLKDYADQLSAARPINVAHLRRIVESAQAIILGKEHTSDGRDR